MGRTSRNKLKMDQVMRKSKKLVPHLLETKRMTSQIFWDMVSRHREVIVKPNSGRRGRGVIKVTARGNHNYEIHYGNKRTTLSGKKQTYAHLRRKTGARPYVVQRRIPLIQIKGRSADFRVIVQRKNRFAPWKVTAKVVKLAGRGYIVTNIARSKGNVLTLEQAKRNFSIEGHSHKHLFAKIDRVTLLAAKQLSTYFKGHRIFGFDVGVDSKGNIRIIEANRWPMMTHFKKLKDQSMYKRIRWYKRRH